MSKDKLIPLIKAKNAASWNKRTNETPETVEAFKKARKDLKKARQEAIDLWTLENAKDVNDINLQPHEAWNKMQQLQKGINGHWQDPKEMPKMKFPDGKVATTDEESAKAVKAH